MAPVNSLNRSCKGFNEGGEHMAIRNATKSGHEPVGASAQRITMSMLYELMRRGGGTEVAAICGGVAQGEGIVIKV